MTKKRTVINLKLLIDTKNNKVLFAEAGKEFVDFLFQIMSLPIATIINLLNTVEMTGCLGDLYKSIESLSTDYIHACVTKDSVLKPKTQVNVPLLLLNDAPNSLSKTLYSCPSYCRVNYANYVTDDSRAVCPNCSSNMTINFSKYIPYVAGEELSDPGSHTNGFVKDVVTYMVMGNLEIKPMSAISSIVLMNKFQVKDIGSVMEKEVEFGPKEAKALLKASLETNEVLTSVFLGDKRKSTRRT